MASARGGVEVIESLRCGFRGPRLRGSWRHLAVRPNGSVLKVLLFPNGDRPLKSVDGESASLKRSRPVSRTDRDEDARLADLQTAQPMRNGYEVNGKFLVDLRGNFPDFSQRHGFVSFVVKIKRAPTVRMVAHAAVERDYGAVFRGAHMADQGGVVDRVAHKSKKIGL